MNDGTTEAVKKGRSVIRSLGKDVRVVLVERERSNVRIDASGRLLRGQRMVVHNVADVPLVFAVMVRRRTFFQEDPSIVFLMVRLLVAPPDEVEVEPDLVAATLVSRADTKSFMVNGECAALANVPLLIRTRD